MKLLQINDYTWVNPEKITCIEQDESEYAPHGSYVFLEGQNRQFWSNKTILQLMSEICEEVYYGDDGICKEDK